MLFRSGCCSHPGLASPDRPALAAAPAKPADASQAPRRITFLGDSITAWGDWQRRFPDATLINAGRPGDTSLDLLARLGPVRAGRPDLVLLMVGINDLLRGARAEAVAERVGMIRQLLAEGGRVRVIQQSTLACEARRCGEIGRAHV